MWSWLRNEQVCSSQIPCSSMKVFPRRLNSNRTKKSHKSRGFSDTLVETLSGHYCRVERRRLPQPQMLSDAFLAPWLAENKVCFASFSCSSETLVRVIFFPVQKKKKGPNFLSVSQCVCVLVLFTLLCLIHKPQKSSQELTPMQSHQGLLISSSLPTLKKQDRMVKLTQAVIRTGFLGNGKQARGFPFLMTVDGHICAQHS